MKPLAHGYTNHTAGDGAVVVKTYAGPDAAARADREHAALAALTGRVPVPPVLGRDAGTLTVAHVEGAHGQDLIAAGQASRVLAACGQVLGDIHLAGWAHGDFGPNNVLLDPDSWAVTAVLDWEFAAHPRRCEDLLDFVRRWGATGPGVGLWRDRLAATAGWSEG